MKHYLSAELHFFLADSVSDYLFGNLCTVPALSSGPKTTVHSAAAASGSHFDLLRYVELSKSKRHQRRASGRFHFKS